MPVRPSLPRSLAPSLAVAAALLAVSAPLAAPAASAAPAQVAASRSCQHPLVQAERDALLAATDTSTLRTVRDVQARLVTINSVLARNGDARGAFPLVYQVIVERTIASVEAGVFADPVWAERLAVEFAAEYLRNLYGHLRGTSMTAYWREYYRLAADCTRSPGRVVAQGIVNHLVDDLPRTLRAVGTTQRNSDDYQLYGLALVEATPRIVTTFQQHYGVDLAPLFQLWAVGDVVGPVEVTTFFFSSVRNLAWVNFEKLRVSTLGGTVSIAASWAVASAAVAGVDLAGGV